MENQIKTTINHHNSYGVFCMANIIGVNTRELDLIWDKAIKMYNLFESSTFNVDTMSELDCMESFYKHYQARQEFLKSGTYIMLDKRVRDIVHNAIDELKTIEIDGECMEFIIKNLGMEDQMLSQLGFKLESENHSLKHRLKVISENIAELSRWVGNDSDEPLTLLSNIEIACDLSSDESLSWIIKL
jgi:hypothetical protein